MGNSFSSQNAAERIETLELGGDSESAITIVKVFAPAYGISIVAHGNNIRVGLVTNGVGIHKSLAAKCTTLRSALSSEQETDARVRTGKITVPLVGMSLLIMAAVVYPALNFSR